MCVKGLMVVGQPGIESVALGEQGLQGLLTERFGFGTQRVRQVIGPVLCLVFGAVLNIQQRLKLVIERKAGGGIITIKSPPDLVDQRHRTNMTVLDLFIYRV
ncbi:hypothetical protein D3C85_1101280 [compost metagenome]